eukprot:gene8609-556_t
MSFPLNKKNNDILQIITQFYSSEQGVERNEKLFLDSFSATDAIKWLEENQKFTKEKSITFLELLRCIGVFRNANDFRKKFTEEDDSFYQFSELVQNLDNVEKIIIPNYSDIKTLRKTLLFEDALQQFYADFVEQGLEENPSKKFDSKCATKWFCETYNINLQAAIYLENIFSEHEIFQLIGNPKKLFNEESNYELINFMEFVDCLPDFTKNVKLNSEIGHFVYYSDSEIAIMKQSVGKKPLKNAFKSSRTTGPEETSNWCLFL